MKETDYYPSFISLDIEHSDDVPAVQLAVEYARCLREAGRGEVVAYSLPEGGVARTSKEPSISSRRDSKVFGLNRRISSRWS